MKLISTILLVIFLVEVTPISTVSLPGIVEKEDPKLQIRVIKGNGNVQNEEEGESTELSDYDTESELAKVPNFDTSTLKLEEPNIQQEIAKKTGNKFAGSKKISRLNEGAQARKQENTANNGYGRKKTSSSIADFQNPLDNMKRKIPKEGSTYRGKPFQAVQDQVNSNNMKYDIDGSPSSTALLPDATTISSISSLIKIISNLSNKSAAQVVQQLDHIMKRFPEESSVLGSIIGPLRTLVQNKNLLDSFQGLPMITSELKSPLEFGNFVLEPVTDFLEQALYVSLEKAGQAVNNVGEIVDTGFEAGKNFIDALEGSNSPVRMIPGVGVLVDTSSRLGRPLRRALDVGHMTVGGTIESAGNNIRRAGKTGLLAAQGAKMQKNSYLANGVNLNLPI